MKVLITGASSGIGRSLAYEFSKRGYDLVLVARNLIELKKLQKEIGTQVHVEVYAYDLAIVDNCIKLHENVSDIDILVNNAGFGLFGDFVSVDLDRELAMIDINIKALHILMKLYLKDMVASNRGQILNVASIAGFMPGPLMGTYYASKNYVVRISEAVREELRRKKSKVQISILCPGPVDTNFNQVAGVSFGLKSLSSEYVAGYAIKKLENGKFYIVPGNSIRLLRGVSRFVPTKILSFFVYLSQKRKG